MDDSAFDTATRRVPTLLSRRRSLGLLSVLGLGAGLLNDVSEAKKGRKKKNKKGNKGNKGSQPLTCTGCTVCETCVNGACQPVADNTSCGSDAVCQHGACGKTCVPLTPGECPDGTVCVRGLQAGQEPVCATIDEAQCAQPVCTSDANCPRGSICSTRVCGPGGFTIRTICWPVDQV
jgi:hypothetical protein